VPPHGQGRHSAGQRNGAECRHRPRAPFHGQFPTSECAP
jgi:hypothetical protein